MKQMILLCLLLMLCVGSASLVQAQGQNNDQSLIGRAHSEVGSCLGQAHPLIGPGSGNGNGNSGGSTTNGLQSEVSVVGSCFAGGFLKRVTFYYVVFGPPCVPSDEEPCHPPLPLYFQVATVDFDCAGNIVGSTCSDL